VLPELGAAEGVALSEPLGATEAEALGLPEAVGLEAVGLPVAPALMPVVEEQEVRARPREPKPRAPKLRSTPRREATE